jgi:hypothetical protein
MADAAMTATAIIPGTGAQVIDAQLGENSITQGLALYQSADDSKWYIADCTDSDKDAAAGFALGAGEADQWVAVLTGGNMTCDNLSLSAAADAGVYILSEAGEICPAGDVAADDYVTIVGVATSATNLHVNFVVSGVQAVA